LGAWGVLATFAGMGLVVAVLAGWGQRGGALETIAGVAGNIL